MRRDAATERQVQAADPALSTWLLANAGSGKTRVLTDRVARLLLDGTEPQRILCLTYTKAAASEMQNRLFKRLGEWAMLEADKLRDALKELGVDGPVEVATLAKARRLFARAIEAPGGLKIQTIHSFCAALLRRFPLEAGVSPDFTEIDDRAARLLRAEIVEELATGPDTGAMDALAAQVNAEDLDALLADLCRNSAAFSPALERETVWALFDLAPHDTMADLHRDVLLGNEGALIAALIPLLSGSGSNDQKAAAKLRALDLDDISPATLESVLLTGASAKEPFSAKIGSFPTKGLREGSAAPLMPQLDALMQRVETARAHRIALAAAERTAALHQFAGAFLPIYQARKAARGWLDFDDLINRTGDLLTDRGVAQWVLYRLDGGIDHILVDEAQDTSPGQWKVIERLAEEFTAGQGTSDTARTIFVVGDKKQSIYSFQGADLRAFDGMHAHFSAKFDQIAAPWQTLELQHSFRSSHAILRLVDLIAEETRVQSGLGGATVHQAYHETMAGRVDLWPPIEPAPKAEDGDWSDPVDLLGEQHHDVQLARRIAGEIRRMIDTGVQIDTPDGPRPVHEGDFLILVQRRSDLFAEIIRACKAARLTIAGADRLKLGAELAVKDLAALLSFLATPEDDLSLAAALRSPLFGWSEEDLFTLAQPRKPGEYLWEALRKAKEDHPETVSILADMRDSADFLRPYDLLERLLTRHQGRRKFLARLGPEAEDGIDELLSQALAFEQTEVPSLTGFLVWLETDEVEVKRRLEGGGAAIRVMTVHGAKGLEAPIVILPDTIRKEPVVRDEIFRVGQGMAAWRTNSSETPPILAAEREEMRERDRQERMRLLYVAMTRAERWLIVCGAGEIKPSSENWYQLIANGMAWAGAETNLPELQAAMGFGPIHRLGFGDWPADGATTKRAKQTKTELPTWSLTRAPQVDEVEKALSPSDLGGAKALAGEGAIRDEEAAKRHGRQLHLLLEHLVLWPQSDWADMAEALLATGDDAAVSGELEPLLAEATRVLTAPEIVSLLAGGAMTEVEITARLPQLNDHMIHGTIDLLDVSPDRVLVVDYKSNTIVPDQAQDTPVGLLRQLGAYAAALQQTYPDRPIETAIFWTCTGQYMPFDPEIVRKALQSTTIP